MTAPVAAELMRLAEVLVKAAVWAVRAYPDHVVPHRMLPEYEAFRTALTAALAAPQGAGERLSDDELRLCREAWNAAQTTQSGDRFAPDVLRLVMFINRLIACPAPAATDTHSLEQPDPRAIVPTFNTNTTAPADAMERVPGLHAAWVNWSVPHELAGTAINTMRICFSAGYRAALSTDSAKDGVERAYGELKAMFRVNMMRFGASEAEINNKLSAHDARFGLADAPKVPDGWVLVPREPTDEATQRVYDIVASLTTEPTIKLTYSNLNFIYQKFIAMLSAAPQADDGGKK